MALQSGFHVIILDFRLSVYAVCASVTYVDMPFATGVIVVAIKIRALSHWAQAKQSEELSFFCPVLYQLLALMYFLLQESEI